MVLLGWHDGAERLSRAIGVIKQTNTKTVEVLQRDSEALARIQDGFHTIVLARAAKSDSRLRLAASLRSYLCQASVR